MQRFIYSILITVLLAGTATAQTLGHTDLTSFNNEVPTGAIFDMLDFESLSGGDLIASGDSLNGFEFGFDFEGVLLRVGGANTTSSSPNYLGTNDADLLQDGDDFTLTMDPSNAFGIHFVTRDILLDGDISLTFNGATVSIIAMDNQMLSDDSLVYFLGITSDQTDTTAMITTLADGVFLYNVDDVIRAEYGGCLLGDVNMDGVINLLDVDPFIAALASGAYQCEADTNKDGVINLLDVEPFISILAS